MTSVNINDIFIKEEHDIASDPKVSQLLLNGVNSNITIKQESNELQSPVYDVIIKEEKIDEVAEFVQSTVVDENKTLQVDSQYKDLISIYDGVQVKQETNDMSNVKPTTAVCNNVLDHVKLEQTDSVEAASEHFIVPDLTYFTLVPTVMVAYDTSPAVKIVGEAKKPSYKYCMVPECKNSNRNSPDKVFFRIPSDEKMRRRWCKMMRRVNVSPLSCLYCCEDHFNIKEDTTNYIQYSIMKEQGGKYPLRLKKGILPHIFACQRRNVGASVERKCVAKRKRMALVNEALSEFDCKINEK